MRCTGMAQFSHAWRSGEVQSKYFRIAAIITILLKRGSKLFPSDRSPFLTPSLLCLLTLMRFLIHSVV